MIRQSSTTPSTSDPQPLRVVVLIPSYNKPSLLRTAIHSARDNAGYPFQMVVSDDLSPEREMQDYLARLRKDPQVTILSHDAAPHGFPHNVNFAVRTLAPDPSSPPFDVLVLLNPDTRACGGWLREMMREFANPEVGIVGAKLVYPKDAAHPLANRIQHAGVAFDSAGSPYHIWRGVNKRDPEVNIRREVNCVTFACAGIRMKTWQEIGPLDEDFVGGQFEDVDYCLRARAAGWKVVYQPKCELYHVEHGSDFPGLNEASQRNFTILHRKWPHVGSDEYLFEPFQWSLITDDDFMVQAAKLFHTARVGGMRYAMEHNAGWQHEATLRLALTGFDAQPESEKRICQELVERLAELLRMQREGFQKHG